MRIEVKGVEWDGRKLDRSGRGIWEGVGWGSGFSKEMDRG